jgi:hypothetical protein
MGKAEKVKNFIKPLLKHIIALLILAAALTVLQALKQDRYISEYVFARGISRYYIEGVGRVTSLLPFSLYEIIVALLIIYLIYFVVKFIRLLIKKRFLKATKRILSLAVAALCLVLLYNSTASFAYNREPLNLNLTEEKPDAERVYAIAQHVLNDYNALAQSFERDAQGNIIPPYGFSALSDKIKAEFDRLVGGYFGQPPRAKPMLFSEVMSYFGLSGIFMSITAEPNINAGMPPKDLPGVVAHEMAHSSGVMRENEANLTAYYLLLSSSDGYLRYSGYAATFGQMLAAVNYVCGEEQYNELKNSIDPLIIKENINAMQYWAKYDSFFDDIADFFNNLYLKLSGVKEGTISYQNPYEVIDTGETDEEGEPVIEINFSNVQKIYFTVYDGVI